jgi:hypothetical protein
MNTTMVVIAIISALALFGVVAVTVIVIAPQAEAGCERGPAINKSFQKSNGRCFDRGTF